MILRDINRISETELVNNIDNLITELKNAVGAVGLGGESSEFAIMTEIFLYKFLNDKFQYEVKRLNPPVVDWSKHDSFDKAIATLSDSEYSLLLRRISGKTARINRDQTISYLFNNQNFSQGEKVFSDLFDETLISISNNNIELFSVSTSGGERIKLFEGVCRYVIDKNNRNYFAKSVINKLAGDTYNFEHVFEQKYDFFSTIFEHLISDYNTNGGGKYAEYYTPKVIARIIAKIMIPEPVQNVTCYDPTAGSGMLLMALAHEIGEDKCTIYSQDKTQKSAKLMRLNLILNNLTHSLNNVFQDDILLKAANLREGNESEFDYIISNPPFKLDFSESILGLSADLNTKNVRNIEGKLEQHKRFFAGIPNIPKKKRDSMAIYLCVIQHIIYSLKENGKAGIVVPTKFLDLTDSIARKIRTYLVDNKWLKTVVSMPSNVFANTGTSVSVFFVDKSVKNDRVFLIDASKLGTEEKVKINNKDVQRTVLSKDDVEKIVNNVRNQKVDDKKTPAVLMSVEDIKAKNYSLVAGQYFDIEIQHSNITKEEFETKMRRFLDDLTKLFGESNSLNKEIYDFLEKSQK